MNCPWGGDPMNNCRDCVYSSEYEFDGQECVKRKSKEKSIKFNIRNYKSVREELEKNGHARTWLDITLAPNLKKYFPIFFVYHKEGKKKNLVTVRINQRGWTFIGEAKLHPDDTFDINIGMRRSTADLIKEYLFQLKTDHEECIEYAIKCYHQICNDIDDLTNFYKLNRASKEDCFEVKRKEF